VLAKCDAAILTEAQVPINGFITSYNFTECKRYKAIKAQEGSRGMAPLFL
jgi:hypothetical protein